MVLNDVKLDFIFGKILIRFYSFIIKFQKPEFTNVCFWYVPKSIQCLDKSSDEYKQKLNGVNKYLFLI